MQLTVKTLKGGKFPVDAEPSNTVLEVKSIIVRLLRLSSSVSSAVSILQLCSPSRRANPHHLASHETLYL